MGDLHCLGRLVHQWLDLLKLCGYPDQPAHRIRTSPVRRNRAEVLLEIMIFDRAHFCAK